MKIFGSTFLKGGFGSTFLKGGKDGKEYKYKNVVYLY
jgi:hypothetical protein